MFKIQNNMGGYCFKGTKQKCINFFKKEKLSEVNWRIVELSSVKMNNYQLNKEKKRDKKEKKKLKSGQEQANYILKKIKHFGLKTIDGIAVKYIEWIGPFSGVYGYYILIDINNTRHNISVGKREQFKPNASDINEIVPGYKEISRKRI